MLEQMFAGNSLKDWGISLLIVVGTFFIVKLISLFNRKVLKPYTQKTKNQFDDIIYNSLDAPILLGIMLLGLWVALVRIQYPDNLVKAVDGAYRILVVLNITWVVSRLVNGLLEVYWGKDADNAKNGSKGHVKMMPVVKRSLLTVVWAIGVAMALSNVGVNISALLGTLGIGGIAFALAAQDTVKNIFGAFTILSDRPFSIGDTVKIDSFEGTIIDVGVRSTRMLNYDKRVVTFPNYKISDASIVNISSEPRRRVVMKLGLTYNTSPEKMKVAMELLRTMPTKVKFVSPNDLVVFFSEFADSALVLTFIYFIEKKGNVQQTTSGVNMEILASFNEAGLEFAYPSQTLYIQGGGEADQA